MIYKVVRSASSGAIAHLKSASDYVEEEGHDPQVLTGTAASRILAYVSRATPGIVPLPPQDQDDLVQEFEERASLRADIERPYMHVVIAYHPSDAERLSTAMRAEIAQTTVQRLVDADNAKRLREGRPAHLLPNAETLLHHWTSHNDKDHPHDHGLLCRVDAQGRVYYAGHDWRIAQGVMADMEQKYGLYRLDVRYNEDSQAIRRPDEPMPVRDPMALAAQDAWLRAGSMMDFHAALADNGITLTATKRGHAFVAGDRRMAAATAGFRRDLAIPEVAKRWKDLARSAPPDQVRREFMAVRARCETQQQFQDALQIRKMAIDGDAIRHRGILIPRDALKLKPGHLVGPDAGATAVPVIPKQPEPEVDPISLISDVEAAMVGRIVDGLRDDPMGPTPPRLRAALEERGLTLSLNKDAKTATILRGDEPVALDPDAMTEIYADAAYAQRAEGLHAERLRIWQALHQRVNPQRTPDETHGVGRISLPELQALGDGGPATTAAVPDAKGRQHPWGLMGVWVDPGVGPWRIHIAHARPVAPHWRLIRDRQTDEIPSWGRMRLDGPDGQGQARKIRGPKI